MSARPVFALKVLLPALLLLLTVPALAEKDVDGLEELLPRQETVWEKLRWLGREQLMPGHELKADPPPVAPLRNCAEWEPCTGVLIRYPLGLPYELLRDFDDDVMLHVIVSSGYEATAQTHFAANGIDMARVQFLVRPNDSIWTRDYGPWFVFDGNGELAIINHTYNRPWRPNDDLIPLYFGQQQAIPVFSHDMFHTGGNYMTDGSGYSSSTRLVYDEAAANNGMSEADVDQLMLDYYGIENYYVQEYIESGGIHHIDTWAKFLDEETVLVKDVWETHWTYDTLNQRATLLASLPASTGRPYSVHRVYCYNIGGSEPASYTNSLILNDAIYVPLFGNSTYDDQALATYAAAAPGYDVRGYSYSGWLSDDALHCRAKGVMDSGMLRVQHVPIREAQIGPVTVPAFAHAHSGSLLAAVELYYRHGDDDWSVTDMEPRGPDSFAASIPEPAAATTTDYYIHVEDASGRQAGMPRTEPAHWYSFSHAPDLTGIGSANERQAAIVGRSFPNPFNPRTRFSFELLHADHVRLDVIDPRGRIVRSLLNQSMPAGHHEIVWDGTSDRGRRLPSGVYIYRLRAAGIQYTRSVTLLK